MGIFCPFCHSHQAIIRNNTPDGGPVTVNNPVMSKTLACGHTVGGAGFMAFMDKVNAARLEAAQAREALDKELQVKLATMSAEALAKKDVV